MKVEVQCSINSGQYDKGDIVDSGVFPNAKELIEKGSIKAVGGNTQVTEPREKPQIIPKRIKKPVKKEKVNE